MDYVLALLGLVSLVAMVVGLVKPTLVIRWGERKIRPMVLMVYGGVFVVSFITFGLFVTPPESVPTTAVPKKVEQPKADKDVAVAKSEMKYTHDQAYKRISDWLGEHQFPDAPSLTLSPGKEDKSLYQVDGKDYHMFILGGLSRSINILVDPNTGELFYHDFGVKPENLNHWFVKYLNNHSGNQTQQANVRIDKNMVWVEMPHIQNGAIVGKIKNTSNRSFQLFEVNFTLYDAQGNQVGQAFDICQSLKAGNTWSFRADVAGNVVGNNVAKFEFDGVQY